MNLRAKIIIGLIMIPIVLIGVPYVLVIYLANPVPDFSIDNTPELPFSISQDFPAEDYTLDEGFQIQLVEGWELVNHTPDRAVDRYRFEKPEDGAILTISFYGDMSSFDAVIANRYGERYESHQEDLVINNFTARRVTAAFEADRNSADVIIKIDENSFMSLYGVHFPTGESSIITTQQINFMQQSFEATPT